MIAKRKLNISGQLYTLFIETEKEDNKFLELDGYTDVYEKEIHICKHDQKDTQSIKDLTKYEIHVLKHEIIHALLFESGQVDYWEDEKLIETLALLYDKLVYSISDGFKLACAYLDESCVLY